jgi:hypothetical protein
MHECWPLANAPIAIVFPNPTLEGQALIRIWQTIIAYRDERKNLTPLVGRGVDTGLKSATSRSFELAIDQFPSYQANKTFIRGRERLVDSTAPKTWQNEAALRRVGHCHASSGVLLRISALFVLVAVLLFGPFADQAQAHGVHAGLTVQMPANWAETTVSRGEAEAESAEAGCGVNCCSATGCAAATLNAAHLGIIFVATDSRFALPGRSSTNPSPQNSLKRPPRA